MSMPEDSLESLLQEVLPRDLAFTVHHISTPPVSCPALYAAPPGAKEEPTSCESHFFSVSIEHESRQLQVFAVEILVYSTAELITLFVSKADSSGYLYLAKHPPTSPSPLKTLTTTILAFLVRARRDQGKRFVLSLFARAQNQYLFPASIENGHKHVLDDQGLIKWWCSVVNPLLNIKSFSHVKDGTSASQRKDDTVEAYVRVPGYDQHETRRLFPAHAPHWHSGDPLQSSQATQNLPERCLIPRFPDDPKARFVETLDAELPEMQDPPVETTTGPSGKWKSIRTLNEFWEAMSFRQECSSGRLVGFLWVVYTPSNTAQGQVDNTSEKKSTEPNGTTEPVATITPTDQSDEHPEPIVEEAPPSLISWPTTGRGEITLTTSQYDEIGKILLDLDYGNIAAALDSTSKWMDAVAKAGDRTTWGTLVTGRKDISAGAPATNANTGDGDNIANGVQANTLGAGLIRKKKRRAPSAELKSETVKAVKTEKNGELAKTEGNDETTAPEEVDAVKPQMY